MWLETNRVNPLRSQPRQPQPVQSQPMDVAMASGRRRGEDVASATPSAITITDNDTVFSVVVSYEYKKARSWDIRSRAVHKTTASIKTRAAPWLRDYN